MPEYPNPLVSVIVPVYNTEDYLERCVESISRQSYSNLEIILVDDGSSDRCPEICETLAACDSRVRVIHQANAGPGIARNAALDVFTGEYVVFVDSDDYVERQMIQEMVGAAEDTGSDLVLCGFRRVNPPLSTDHGTYAEQVQFDNVGLMREYLSKSTIWPGPVAKLFHRELFSTLRFPALPRMEDDYIMHELLGAATRATVIPESYYMYWRAHPTNTTSQTDAMPSHIRAKWAISNRRVDYIADRYPSLVGHARRKRAQELTWLMRLVRFTPHFRREQELYRSLREQLRDDMPSFANLVGASELRSFRGAADDDLLFKIGCLLRLTRTRAKKLARATLGAARIKRLRRAATR